MKYRFINYKNFYFFTRFINGGLLNKQKNNALSFYFTGFHYNRSLINFNLFFYNYICLHLLLRDLLKQQRFSKIIVLCTDQDIFFFVNELKLKYKLIGLSVFLWINGLITNPTITFKSGFVLFSSFIKKKKRTKKTEKNIELVISAGYSKSLLNEIKKRNLPTIGFLECENSFFFDYLLPAESAHSSVYINFNILFYLIRQFYYD